MVDGNYIGVPIPNAKLTVADTINVNKQVKYNLKSVVLHLRIGVNGGESLKKFTSVLLTSSDYFYLCCILFSVKGHYTALAWRKELHSWMAYSDTVVSKAGPELTMIYANKHHMSAAKNGRLFAYEQEAIYGK
jgi:hypothetical protein